MNQQQKRDMLSEHFINLGSIIMQFANADISRAPKEVTEVIHVRPIEVDVTDIKPRTSTSRKVVSDDSDDEVLKLTAVEENA